jgi:hypothetical protein
MDLVGNPQFGQLLLQKFQQEGTKSAGPGRAPIKGETNPGQTTWLAGHICPDAARLLRYPSDSSSAMTRYAVW